MRHYACVVHLGMVGKIYPPPFFPCVTLHYRKKTGPNAVSLRSLLPNHTHEERLHLYSG